MTAKKRYTRKQILEAIKHWSGVLARIDESKSKFLDACSKEFGEAVVFDDQLAFEYSKSNTMKVFELLDAFIFESKLNSIKGLSIFIGNLNELNPIVAKYNKNRPIDLSCNFALYLPDLDFGRNRLTRKLMMRKNSEAIFVNIDGHQHGTFAYLLSTLCHEMIHCYDLNFKTLAAKTLDLIEKGAPSEVISYTSHFTPCFKEKSKLMKQESNLTIRVDGDNKDFEELNKEDTDEIRLLMEDDDMTMFEPIQFDDEFKQKYKDIFSFNGPNSACMIFGKHHHKH